MRLIANIPQCQPLLQMTQKIVTNNGKYETVLGFEITAVLLCRIYSNNADMQTPLRAPNGNTWCLF